ncbi:MAG TPA: response regulator [Candidatus Limnocylindria bacterium]|jgi:CheY-like chemotaxis protein|nr:response regulator [Candidatus Limnocylindria bacterium]
MARVLVVEDDANNLDVASRIIRASGHEALVAADGVAGLDLARVERPDAILVDLLLPRMDGWSLTRSLRSEPWAASIPIIAVSALALPSDRARAIEAGCDDFVSKPFAPAELRAILLRYFPGGAAQVPAARDGQPTVRGPVPIQLGKVLIVDDEIANVELLARRLEAIGCQTQVASSGERAIALARTEQPDLILLDVMMPGMDGWQTCRRLKSQPETAGIPVIFVTAKDRYEDLSKGFEVGGIDYITKPFEPIELAARVRSAIFTKHLQDQLRKSNADLQRMEQSRKELIGMLGHDIRNLANSVVAFMQLVRMGQLEPGRREFDELLRLSESNISELLRMVNALLDVYKMEEGKLEAMPQVIALSALAERSIAQVAPESLAKGIELESSLPQGVAVFVDDGLIVRVLTNLLANAVKHTPTGGKVRIESVRDESLERSIIVRVHDTGPGITADDAPHIFDRFYQGAGRSRGGTGLGLAFCKLAVELHGGTITVVNPGETGAIVQFTLPAADRAAAGA